jgi:hypothetical protein
MHGRRSAWRLYILDGRPVSGPLTHRLMMPSNRELFPQLVRVMRETADYMGAGVQVCHTHWGRLCRCVTHIGAIDNASTRVGLTIHARLLT